MKRLLLLLLPASIIFTNATSQNIFPNTSNAGIGTTRPVFPLTFDSTFGDKISLWGNIANNTSIGFGVQPALLQIHSNRKTDDIGFGYGSSINFFEQMRIKGTGNIGIGVSNPQDYGHGGTNKIVEIYNTDIDSNSQSHLILSTNGSTGSAGGITWASPRIGNAEKRMAFMGGVFEGTGNASKLTFYTRNVTGSLSEKLSVNSNGSLSLRGNAGQPGQVLTSNGSDGAASSPAEWKSPNSFIFNNAISLRLPPPYFNVVFRGNTSGNRIFYRELPTGRFKFLVNYQATWSEGPCAFCGEISGEISVVFDGSTASFLQFKGSSTTSGSVLIDAPAGTHNIELRHRSTSAHDIIFYSEMGETNMSIIVIPE